MIDTLFGFDGRLARLPYFLYGLLLFGLAVVMMLIGGALVATAMTGLVVIGAILFLAVCAGVLWASIALTIKRLHDIGLSGYHAAWIYGVSLVGGIFTGTGLDTLCSIASVVITIWLMAAPGEKDANRYGAVPGA